MLSLFQHMVRRRDRKQRRENERGKMQSGTQPSTVDTAE